MQAEQTSPCATHADLERERALVARACADPDAFAGLYDRYVGRVYSYAFRRLRTHEDAEDVTAQTFSRALEHMQSYEWRDLPFGAWLFRIAHNLVVDRRRGGAGPLSLTRLEADGLELAAAGEEAPDAVVEMKDEVDAAWALVATLPPLQRRAVSLRFGRDLSHAEVGAIIGRSEPATKQLIYRAMKSIRTKMRPED